MSSPVSVSSHYSQQAANIDLELNDWPWRGAQIDVNVVDVLLISCWESSDSLREKEAQGRNFRLCGSSNWRFLWFWTCTKSCWYFSFTYNASFGSWGAVHSSNTLNTQGEHKIKHKYNERLEKKQSVFTASVLDMEKNSESAWCKIWKWKGKKEGTYRGSWRSLRSFWSQQTTGSLKKSELWMR